MSDTSRDTSSDTPVVKPKIGEYRRHILVCTGERCTGDGASQALFDSLGDKFKAAGLTSGPLRVKRTRASCFAACKGGPIVCVQPDGTWYYNVTPENMDRIIEQHLRGGRPVEDLVFHQAGCGDDDEGACHAPAACGPASSASATSATSASCNSTSAGGAA